MSDTDWQLHPVLEADCHVLGRLGSCWRLLHRNATLHWFILVPETTVPDLFDLPREARMELLDQAAGLAAFLKSTLAYPRVNVGALGLVVPQLHLHVIGRRPNDPCWPGPVWGALPPGPGYSAEEVRADHRNNPRWIRALSLVRRLPARRLSRPASGLWYGHALALYHGPGNGRDIAGRRRAWQPQ